MLKNPSNTDILTRMAWLYYKENMTQDEIAKKLNLSRSKVVRLLQKAKDEGIVHFHIISPLGNCLHLEQELKSVFKLEDAMVVPIGEYEKIRETLGKAAAQYLERCLKSGHLFAVGWGRTVYEVARFIRSNNIKNLKIVTLNGGLTTSFYLNPYDVGAKLSSLFGGECYYIHAPAIATSEELCRSFRSDLTVKQALQMAKLANYSLVGIGEMSAETTLVSTGYISLADVEILYRKGVVGNIVGQFFDIEGNVVDCDLHKRIVAFPIEELRKMKNVIGVAGGKDKIKAILGALHGNFVKVLVTDEETATLIMNLEKNRIEYKTKGEAKDGNRS
jgi:DNA-binding transcriptional regulator LsrR (DeoR family)